MDASKCLEDIRNEYWIIGARRREGSVTFASLTFDSEIVQAKKRIVPLKERWTNLIQKSDLTEQERNYYIDVMTYVLERPYYDVTSQRLFRLLETGESSAFISYKDFLETLKRLDCFVTSGILKGAKYEEVGKNAKQGDYYGFVFTGALVCKPMK